MLEAHLLGFNFICINVLWLRSFLPRMIPFMFCDYVDVVFMTFVFAELELIVSTWIECFMMQFWEINSFRGNCPQIWARNLQVLLYLTSFCKLATCIFMGPQNCVINSRIVSFCCYKSVAVHKARFSIILDISFRRLALWSNRK